MHIGSQAVNGQTIRWPGYPRSNPCGRGIHRSCSTGFNGEMELIPDGQALNITLVNNGDNLDFGLVGCRRSAPHLQRLLVHLETALKDLEQAVGA